MSVTSKVPRDDDEIEGAFQRILLASEGRPFTRRTLDATVALAQRGEAVVRVLSIARVHGVAFGLPNPGLLPTKREWDEQRESVAAAVRRLRRKGITAEGHVIGTRRATKQICKEAASHGCEAIVMAADPDRHRIVAEMMWSQEPQRVRRRSRLPVLLVTDPDQAHRSPQRG